MSDSSKGFRPNATIRDRLKKKVVVASSASTDTTPEKSILEKVIESEEMQRLSINDKIGIQNVTIGSRIPPVKNVEVPKSEIPTADFLTCVNSKTAIEAGSLAFCVPALFISRFSKDVAPTQLHVFLELLSLVTSDGIIGRPCIDESVLKMKKKNARIKPDKVYNIIDELSHTSTQYRKPKKDEQIEVLEYTFFKERYMFGGHPLPQLWTKDPDNMKLIADFARDLDFTLKSVHLGLSQLLRYALPIGPRINMQTSAFGVFDVGSLINHSCEPNCWFAFRPGNEIAMGASGHLEVYALKPIAVGEELKIHYAQHTLCRYHEPYLPMFAVPPRAILFPWTEQVICQCDKCVVRLKFLANHTKDDHDQDTCECSDCRMVKKEMLEHVTEFVHTPESEKDSESELNTRVIELEREGKNLSCLEKMMEWEAKIRGEAETLVRILPDNQTDPLILKRLEEKTRQLSDMWFFMAVQVCRIAWKVGLDLVRESHGTEEEEKPAPEAPKDAEKDNEDSEDERERSRQEKRNTGLSARQRRRQKKKQMKEMGLKEPADIKQSPAEEKEPTEPNVVFDELPDIDKIIADETSPVETTPEEKSAIQNRRLVAIIRSIEFLSRFQSHYQKTTSTAILRKEKTISYQHTMQNLVCNIICNAYEVLLFVLILETLSASDKTDFETQCKKALSFFNKTEHPAYSNLAMLAKRFLHFEKIAYGMGKAFFYFDLAIDPHMTAAWTRAINICRVHQESTTRVLCTDLEVRDTIQKAEEKKKQERLDKYGDQIDSKFAKRLTWIGDCVLQQFIDEHKHVKPCSEPHVYLPYKGQEEVTSKEHAVALLYTDESDMEWIACPFDATRRKAIWKEKGVNDVVVSGPAAKGKYRIYQVVRELRDSRTKELLDEQEKVREANEAARKLGGSEYMTEEDEVALNKKLQEIENEIDAEN